MTDTLDLTGKAGSKWRHGYIPLNAAAVALKEHRDPGNISKRGRRADEDSKDKAKRLLKGEGYSLNGHGQAPKRGYMVSLDEKHGGVETTVEGKVAPSDIYRHKIALQQAYAKRNNGRIGSPLDSPSMYHGAWKDPESGKTYLDVSRQHNSIEVAAREAQKMGQLAIFDVKAGKSVPTADALKMAAKAKRDREYVKSQAQAWRNTTDVVKTVDNGPGFENIRADGDRTTIKQDMRSAIRQYGSDRTQWTMPVLKALAHVDPLSQLEVQRRKGQKRNIVKGDVKALQARQGKNMTPKKAQRTRKAVDPRAVEGSLDYLPGTGQEIHNPAGNIADKLVSELGLRSSKKEGQESEPV